MPASSRDMNIPVLATLGVVTAILIFVIVVATQAWFRYEQNREHEVKVILQPNTERLDRQQQELAKLQGYRLIDEQKQVVAIPIEQAMKDTVSLYQNRPAAQ